MNNQYALLFVLTIFLFPYFLSAQDEDAALQAAEIQLTGAQAAKDRTALADAHLKLADLHHVKNHFPLSRDHYLQSLQNRDSIQDTDVWAAIHRKLGDAYTRVGSFEEALGALRIAADYYQSQHMLNKLGDTKRLIGAARIALGDLDEAEREFLECLELFAPENAVDTTTLADALLATGILYSKKADYPQALTYYHRAEDLYRAQNNRQRLMYVYNNISGTYLAEGNTPKTLDYLLQALSLSEEFDFKLGVLGGLSNIAMVYQIQKDYEQSLKYLERAERLNLEVGDSSQMARILSNKGVALQELNRTEEALDNHLKSLQLRTAIGDKTGMASSHLKLGTLYVKLGDLELANDHLNTALQLWKEAGDQKGIAKSYEELGDLALAQHQYQTALDWCQKGYAIAGPLKLAEELEGTCLCLTNAYEKTGDFRRALAFHQRYITVRDSTVNGERTRELTRMEMQYTFDAEKERITLEQQQKEALLHAQIQRQRLIRNGSIGGLAAGLLIIALLWRSYRQKQKSNRLLETQKNTIQQTLEERETLLKEIHHRVKNNLQVISSLLGLQALSIKDQQVLDAIEEGRNRV
ncbi:MAG: tetratricopeptide repeat protein, partial [Lewinella sp.]|nr:tetratricopeptide repeat protein [Lewinella sp.]